MSIKNLLIGDSAYATRPTVYVRWSALVLALVWDVLGIHLRKHLMAVDLITLHTHIHPSTRTGTRFSR